MPDNSLLPARKTDHIRINLEEDVSSAVSNGLERYHFIHQALPEYSLKEIDISQNFCGKTLHAPLLISSMTGGTSEAMQINQVLAIAAQEAGVAMGLGSIRAAIENGRLTSTFQVRSVAPDILLFANLGAVQLNYGYTVDECRKAVEIVEADALVLHLNALQEALQPEGETDFSDLLRKIEKVSKELPVPVIAKEVGWGISALAAKRLASAGVAAIDVAGAGGTSWSQVEMYRTTDHHLIRQARAFRDWGIPTAESILEVKSGAPGLPILASGGLRNGVEIAKCIALGATLGGLAAPFLKAAAVSLDETRRLIEEISSEIRICLFCAGVTNLQRLQETPLRTVTNG